MTNCQVIPNKTKHDCYFSRWRIYINTLSRCVVDVCDHHWWRYQMFWSRVAAKQTHKRRATFWWRARGEKKEGEWGTICEKWWNLMYHGLSYGERQAEYAGLSLSVVHDHICAWAWQSSVHQWDDSIKEVIVWEDHSSLWEGRKWWANGEMMELLFVEICCWCCSVGVYEEGRPNERAICEPSDWL